MPPAIVVDASALAAATGVDYRPMRLPTAGSERHHRSGVRHVAGTREGCAGRHHQLGPTLSPVRSSPRGVSERSSRPTALDKNVSKQKHEIGTGCIEGVAGQAAADEAAARTSFIPLMSIGIPENAVMALMLAAFIIKGIQPGPNMIVSHPELFWGLVASMWIGNVFLLVLNVPLVRYWLSVFKIPYSVLFPSIFSSAASAPTA